MKGYIQVYTGNGKGKTTAALGLALRAVGNNKKVFIGQFVKGMKYSEVETISQFLPMVKISQYGLRCFIDKAPEQKDIEAAQKGLSEIKKILLSQKYDIVILDEANIAVYFNLFTIDELIEVLKLKPEETEIVITGRYAHEKLIEVADLVTDMLEIKHYYNSGVLARKGIEC